MKAVWNLARAGVAAAALALAGAAQGAVVYDVNFDPLLFFGNGTLDVGDPCLALSDGFHNVGDADGCFIDVVSMYAHDTGAGNWNADGGSFSSFELENHVLVGLEGDVSMFFQGFDDSSFRFAGGNTIQGAGCDSPADLSFSTDGNTVSFNGCASDTGNYTLTQVPEPASMALTLGALGAAWFARRRRKQS
jgi:hypothetical protein